MLGKLWWLIQIPSISHCHPATIIHPLIIVPDEMSIVDVLVELLVIEVHFDECLPDEHRSVI